MALNDNKYNQKEHHLLSNFTWLLTGAAVGATLTYFLDPSHGKRRRIVAYDKGVSFKKHSLKFGGKVMRNLKNHLVGYIAETKHLLKGTEKIDDVVLVERVRAMFGRKIKHASSIDVKIKNGIATLSGPILSKEYDTLIKSVQKVPGIKNVINKLDLYDSSANIPGLQGEGKPYLQ